MFIAETGRFGVDKFLLDDGSHRKRDIVLFSHLYRQADILAGEAQPVHGREVALEDRLGKLLQYPVIAGAGGDYFPEHLRVDAGFRTQDETLGAYRAAGKRNHVVYQLGNVAAADVSHREYLLA